MTSHILLSYWLPKQLSFYPIGWPNRSPFILLADYTALFLSFWLTKQLSFFILLADRAALLWSYWLADFLMEFFINRRRRQTEKYAERVSKISRPFLSVSLCYGWTLSLMAEVEFEIEFFKESFSNSCQALYIWEYVVFMEKYLRNTVPIRDSTILKNKHIFLS